jgi:hypothetical protein
MPFCVQAHKPNRAAFAPIQGDGLFYGGLEDSPRGGIGAVSVAGKSLPDSVGAPQARSVQGIVAGNKPQQIPRHI